MSRRPASRRVLRVGVAALTLGVGLTGAGCGISEDRSPRALNVSTTTTQPLSTPTVGRTEAIVYYLLDDRLVPVRRALPDGDLSTVFDAVMEPPAGTDGISDLTTAIPAGTRARKLTRNGTTLEVDLTGDLENLAGTARQQAAAQMVMTATEFPGVRTVRFSINGTPIQVTSPVRGDRDTVDGCDFANLLLGAEQARADGLADEVVAHLEATSATLGQRCPPPNGTRS